MPLEGKPLFIRQVERVQAATLCGKVVVATTLSAADDLIADTCLQEGLECFRGDADDLLDRHYQAACQYQGDTVIKIPSDCPLLDPAGIDKTSDYYPEQADPLDYVCNLHTAPDPAGNEV